MTALAQVLVAVDGLGQGMVEVNGQQLPCRSLTVFVRPGELTTCVVELGVDALELDVHGAVEIDRGPGPEAVEQLARLLEGLSPAELERRALASPELTNEPNALTRQLLREAAAALRGES